ncbi:ATP-binding cassette domain-containing protein [Kibdelosporangium philippinense]|uniref:ATP-binding cassette domain-containing protein n=1 Tax=Kibdelosporangium philippinense TaxID=211113 RepID=A0ABS8ZJJ5_9PSEU|nr:ATP-binding cassette domain-containing protein [Kibdelosporangium philippinense]MCE7007966.1 ATP-binding cassette domain-containing protein [Kibdelosporangium philippinense]
MAIGGRPVLADESVRCSPSTMTALVGPSGSGKTTLLHCLGLLFPVTKGRIVVDGTDVTNYKPAARRRFWRDHAAFVLQDYGIMDEETVAFNVTMQSSILGRRVTGDLTRMSEVLAQVGLEGRQNEAASHLSGGEKQRLALARAMYKQARIVFVDEPTASLDALNRKKVIDLFADFAASGCTVIVATHDPEMIDACGAQHGVS